MINITVNYDNYVLNNQQTLLPFLKEISLDKNAENNYKYNLK